MNIINGIARRGSPCALAPPSLAQRSKRCGRGAPVNMACTEINANERDSGVNLIRH